MAVLALLEQPQFRSLINDADLSELDDDENEISSELSTANVNDPISLNNNSANNTNLIVNHQYEPNDYFDTNDPPPSRYDSQNQNMFSATDSNYATDSNFKNSNSFIDNRNFDRFFEVPASSNALTYANLTNTSEASVVLAISNSISNFDAQVDSVQSNSNNQEALTVSNVLPAIKRGRGRPPLTAEEKLKRCNDKALLNPLAKKSKKN